MKHLTTRTTVLLLLCGALVVTCQATADTILVDLGGGGDYFSIKPAVEAAASGDTILIAPGYYEGAANRDMNLSDKNLVIRGIAGAEATTVWCSRQARGFRVVGGQDSTCVFEGITIGYGKASDGGALWCEDTSPRFIDCIFRSCYAVAHGEMSGGIAYIDGGSPSFQGCLFKLSHAGDEWSWGDGFGGAVYCVDSSPTFSGCTFWACDTQGGGGGAVYSLNSMPVFTDCLFEDNGGRQDPSDPMGDGGGVLLSGGGATFTDVTFLGNYDYRGGAVRCESAAATFTDVRFFDNRGSIEGGAVSCVGGGPYDFERVVFDWNVNTYDGGGGIAVREATVVVDECTFVRNRSPLGSSIACLTWGDVDVSRTIMVFGIDDEPVYCTSGSVPTITQSCVFGNSGSDSLCGDYSDNVFENPQFCDLGAADYTLYSHSVCLPPGNPWGVQMGALGEGCLYPGPLEAPSDVVVSGDDRAAFLSWYAVSDPIFGHYRVERDTSVAFGEFTSPFDTIATEFIDSPLENGREYFYRVIAVDTLGGWSAPSDTVSVVVNPTAPAVPEEVLTTSGDETVLLSWQASAESDLDHYRVYRDTLPGVAEEDLHASVAVPAYVDASLVNYDPYYYRVAAVDTGGLVSDLSNEVLGVPHLLPPAVSGFEALPGDGSAFLSWSPVVPACQEYYNVYRDTVSHMHSAVAFQEGFETYGGWSSSRQERRSG